MTPSSSSSAAAGHPSTAWTTNGHHPSSTAWMTTGHHPSFQNMEIIVMMSP
ncbi:hypothetical protein ACHAW5_003523 [Stephanodiscus triporus]|uniref:Uncharacterized protein n=1 Tax=Stephanodiscus triporus TaxID=2934178 RepID=A0ABD3NK30_9STRA